MVFLVYWKPCRWLGLRWSSIVSVYKVKWLWSSQLTKPIAVDEFKSYLQLTFHVFLFLALLGTLLIFQLLLPSIATLTSCKVLKSLKSAFPEYVAKSVKYVISKLSNFFSLTDKVDLGRFQRHYLAITIQTLSELFG